MARPARKIPTHEWERHKDVILGLYQPGPGNTLGELVRVMEEQHGFSARYVSRPCEFHFRHVTNNTQPVFLSLRVSSVSGELVKTSNFMNGSPLLRP